MGLQKQAQHTVPIHCGTSLFWGQKQQHCRNFQAGQGSGYLGKSRDMKRSRILLIVPNLHPQEFQEHDAEAITLRNMHAEAMCTWDMLQSLLKGLL